MKTVFAILSSLLLLASTTTTEAACPFGHDGGAVGEPEAHNTTVSASAPLGAHNIFGDSPSKEEGAVAGSSSAGSAEDKRNAVRTKIAATSGHPAAWPPATEVLKLFLEDMRITEDLVSDEMVDSGHGVRKKLIHSSGAVAEVALDWLPSANTNKKYTGLFQGANYGFIRMSSATEPDYSKEDPQEGNFAPGISMKFFRDDKPSGHLFALHTLAPYWSWNFFNTQLSNHLPIDDQPPKEAALVKKFSGVSDWAGFLGLSSFARYTENGVTVSDEEINFPFQLIFKPNESLEHKFPHWGTGHDLYSTQLKDLPAGQHLYSIYAKHSRTTPEEHIGDVYTTSMFVESSYADQTMFMQHTRFEDDLKLRPDMMDGCNGITECRVCPVETAC